MKKLLSVIPILLAFDLGAATLRVPVQNFTQGSVTNRRATLTQTVLYTATETNIVMGEPVSQYTDANGIAWFSNLLAGNYRLDISGNPSGSWTLLVPDDPGVWNAQACITTTLPKGNLLAFTATASDARYASFIWVSNLINSVGGPTNGVTAAVMSNAIAALSVRVAQGTNIVLVTNTDSSGFQIVTIHSTASGTGGTDTNTVWQIVLGNASNLVSRASGYATNLAMYGTCGIMSSDGQKTFLYVDNGEGVYVYDPFNNEYFFTTNDVPYRVLRGRDLPFLLPPGSPTNVAEKALRITSGPNMGITTNGSDLVLTASISGGTASLADVTNVASILDTALSNSLRSAFLSADTTTSNGLVSTLGTASNNLQAAFVANDTTTSNGLSTRFVANDTTTSNGVLAAANAYTDGHTGSGNTNNPVTTSTNLFFGDAKGTNITATNVVVSGSLYAATQFISSLVVTGSFIASNLVSQSISNGARVVTVDTNTPTSVMSWDDGTNLVASISSGLPADAAGALTNNGTGGKGWWDIVSAMNTATNTVWGWSKTFTLTASNNLQGILVANDTTTSNGVVSAIGTASNNLQSAFVANDTTTSNGLSSRLVSNDTTTSNGLVTLVNNCQPTNGNLTTLGGNSLYTNRPTASTGITFGTTNADGTYPVSASAGDAGGTNARVLIISGGASNLITTNLTVIGTNVGCPFILKPCITGGTNVWELWTTNGNSIGMCIQSNGTVQIGTNGGMTLYLSNTAAGANAVLSLVDGSGAVKFQVGTNGNVGVAKASSTTPLDVTGAATVSGNVQGATIISGDAGSMGFLNQSRFYAPAKGYLALVYDTYTTNFFGLILGTNKNNTTATPNSPMISTFNTGWSNNTVPEIWIEGNNTNHQSPANLRVFGTITQPSLITNQVINTTWTTTNWNGSNTVYGLVTMPTGLATASITNNYVTTNTVCLATVNSDDTTAFYARAVCTANLITLRLNAAATTNCLISWFIKN